MNFLRLSSKHFKPAWEIVKGKGGGLSKGSSKCSGEIKDNKKRKRTSASTEPCVPSVTSHLPSILFIAGGIGATPVRSLIREHGNIINWRLVHVARDQKHLYEKEFTTSYNNVQLRTDHAGAEESVTVAIAEHKPDWIYVCGSERFAAGMQEILRREGVSEEKIRVESFRGGLRSKQ